MSDLAPFVAAVLRDRVVEGTLEEIRRLREEIRLQRETIENIRSNVREIEYKAYTVTWGGPSQRPGEATELGAETEDNGWTTYSNYTLDEDGYHVEIDGGPDMEFEVFRRAELRFGTFYSIPASAFSLHYYVDGVQRNPRNGQVEFSLYLWAAYFDDVDDGPSNGDVGLIMCPPGMPITVSIEQLAVLSGLSTTQIQSEFNLDKVEAEKFTHFDVEWKLQRVPLDIMDALESVWGENGEIKISCTWFDKAFMERKCLLL